MGLECEYGSNPSTACNEIATCDSTGWSFSGASGPSTCPGGTCPATYADVPQNKTCTPLGLDCAYAQGQCNCARTALVSVGDTPVWQCSTPATGCPEPRPRLGSACSQPSLECDYGACTGGIAEQCLDGIWQRAETACPG